MCKSVFFSTMVFIDTETTGLPNGISNPHITEICMLAVSRFALENSLVLPRVQNKLVLCFNPQVEINNKAAEISGLSSEDLFHQKDFDLSAVDIIQLFLLRLDPPITLLAQNGFRFDFPLIKSEILRVKGEDFTFTDCAGSPIVFADTLYLFRFLREYIFYSPEETDSGIISLEVSDMSVSETGEKFAPLCTSTPTKSSAPEFIRPIFSLVNIYKHIFGEEHAGMHSAEGDCFAMLKIIHHLGISALSWIDSNYRLQSSIAPMYPIGKNEKRPLGVSLFPYSLQCSTSIDELDNQIK